MELVLLLLPQPYLVDTDAINQMMGFKLFISTKGDHIGRQFHPLLLSRFLQYP